MRKRVASLLTPVQGDFYSIGTFEVHRGGAAPRDRKKARKDHGPIRKRLAQAGTGRKSFFELFPIRAIVS